jgi:hypothetical protein
MTRRTIKVGDWITFTATTRDGRRKVTRKVVGLRLDGLPQVRFHGWDRFDVGCFPGDIIHAVRKTKP